MRSVEGPLGGLRVLELGGIGPGPYAGMLLADMGADVVRVDRLDSSPMDSPIMRRGKRSVGLNLRTPDGVASALTLAAAADALIEGFRPGVAERLGIGPSECLARNPALVYGRMTGWGQTGPWTRAVGHDINYISMTGALHAIGPADGPPSIPLCIAGDLGGGGMYLVTGLLAALLHARATGRGQVVDAAIVDGAATLMAPVYGRLAAGDWVDERAANKLDGGRPWYSVYRTRDDRWLAVGAIEAPFYAALLRTLEIDPVEGDRADPARWPALRALFESRFSGRTRAEWEALFAGTDACVTPVLGLHEARAHELALQRDMFDAAGLPRPGPRFSETPVPPSREAPRSGAHTAEVIAEWT